MQDWESSPGNPNSKGLASNSLLTHSLTKVNVSAHTFCECAFYGSTSGFTREFCVCSAEEKIDCNECIESDKPTSEIRAEPYSLPSGFHWDTLDINDPMVVRIPGPRWGDF